MSDRHVEALQRQLLALKATVEAVAQQLAAALVTSQLLAADTEDAPGTREANGGNTPQQDTRTFGARREAQHGADSDAGRRPGRSPAAGSAGRGASVEEFGSS